MELNFDAPLAQILMSFREFKIPRTPKTKKMQVTFENIIGGDLTQEVKEMLKLGTQQRRLLVQGLTYAGAVPNPQNVIEAVNAYLPSVWKIQKSLEHSKDTKIRIKSPLYFEWSSGLANSSVPDEQRAQGHGVFVFEVAMLLVVRALSHYNVARQHMERLHSHKNQSSTGRLDKSDPMITSCIKESINHLRLGSGVLDFAVTQVLANWRHPPAKPLPETSPRVLKALSLYFLTQAHRLFILRILIAGNLSQAPNLLMGLATKSELAARTLNTSPADPGTFFAVQDFWYECAFFDHFAQVMALKYCGLQIMQKIERSNEQDQAFIDSLGGLEAAFGTAVGYLRLCNKEINKKNFAVITGHLKFKNIVKLEISDVTRTLQNAEEENSSVYFGPVDEGECELPGHAFRKFMVVAEAFVMPEVSVLSFKEIERAPPEVSQEAFDAMPPEMKKEMWDNYKKQEADRIAKAKEEAKGKGIFGFGKRQKKAAPKAQPAVAPVANQPAAVGSVLRAPPGVDPEVFNALPEEIKIQVINERAPAAAGGTAGAKPAAKKKGKDLPIW